MWVYIMDMKLKSWIIKTFGLKGSWKWACKQMQQGRMVGTMNTTGHVRYRLDNEAQERILWAFHNGPTYKDFRGANIFLQDFERVDWVVK